MADVTVDSAVSSSSDAHTGRELVWVSPTTGYIFFIDGTGQDMHYRKTTDSGATWTTEVTIESANLLRKFAIWYDRWTAGDTGTRIHIAWLDDEDDDITYNYLDTSDDSLGTKVQVVAGTTSAGSSSWASECCAITKSRGGNIFVGGWIDAAGENGFAKGNADPPTSFTGKTSMADGNAVDRIQFVPGNETDTDDIWCFYQDVSANALTLKVYDDSANAWAESVTVDSITEGTWLQYDTVSRHSDGHTLLANWNGSASSSDLAFFDFTTSGSWTQKADVVTNRATRSFCGIFLNQQNDDVYVCYPDGAGTHNIDYKKSVSGGTSWGTETQFNVTAADHRGVTGGTQVDGQGGRFQPIWHNDNLNDLVTNTDNSIEIAATAVDTNMTINVGDAWKTVDGGLINVGDSWKTIDGALVNVGDAWKTIF